MQNELDKLENEQTQNNHSEDNQQDETENDEQVSLEETLNEYDELKQKISKLKQQIID
jgi:hypothetical protein